ncbi:hypothetical protein KEM56_006591 [Ascosphaera pollenicola]|nr:hypothetical protein KEM56_006591 [Ascosphaera pollenicola]
MSFLNSLISSIETRDPTKYAPPPAPARKPRQPPPSASASVSGSARSSAETEQRDRARSLSSSSVGVKRKAESISRNDDIRTKVMRPETVVKNVSREPHVPASTPSSQVRPGISKSSSAPKTSSNPPFKPAPKPAPANATSTTQPKTSTPRLTTPSASSTTTAMTTTKSAPATAASKPTTASKPAPSAPIQSKPPPKGSYAEIMARAKALQEKAPAPPEIVPVVKHLPQPKERLSKVQLKKKAEEAKLKEQEEAKAKKQAGKLSRSSSNVSAPESRQEKIKALKKSDGPEYRGTARPRPAAPEPPAYKGTARRPPPERQNPSRLKTARSHPARRSRLDEYLATDEEDEGGDYFGGYDDYYSDSSEDMEAGISDVEQEEALALRFAKKEDEEELKAEMAAKREKLARKKKLMAASRR